jgi:putative ABC transport system substrate-binding protein
MNPPKSKIQFRWFAPLAVAFGLCLLAACSHRSGTPVVGFLDFVQDATLDQARQGFFDALEKQGFSEADGTLEVKYLNAQGDIPTLGQACDLLISKKVDLLAASTTLSTITAVQRTKTLPICMMVAPRPDIAGLSASPEVYPANLFGVYETLAYIDTAVALVRELMPGARRIGTVYNQAEPQSRDAFERLRVQCDRMGLSLESLPVNNSSETQLVTASLLSRGIDVFFALPDNVIFASFETIAKNCSEANVPIFTSEAGLVARGAVVSYGADFYQWGYQAGEQAATFLRTRSLDKVAPEIVRGRQRVYNPEAAARFGLRPDTSFVKSD